MNKWSARSEALPKRKVARLSSDKMQADSVANVAKKNPLPTDGSTWEFLRLDPAAVVNDANKNTQHLEEIKKKATEILKYTEKTQEVIREEETKVKKLFASGKCVLCCQVQKAGCNMITCLCFDADQGHGIQVCRSCQEKQVMKNQCDSCNKLLCSRDDCKRRFATCGGTYHKCSLLVCDGCRTFHNGKYKEHQDNRATLDDNAWQPCGCENTLFCHVCTDNYKKMEVAFCNTDGCEKWLGDCCTQTECEACNETVCGDCTRGLGFDNPMRICFMCSEVGYVCEDDCDYCGRYSRCSDTIRELD